CLLREDIARFVNMGDTGGADEEKKKKERGPVGRMLFKVGERLGIVEQTRLAPEFVAEIEKYYKYQDAVEKIVGGIEATLQNDAKVLAEGFIECPEKMDPYEQFAKNIKAFRQFQPEDKKVSFNLLFPNLN
uniref:BAR domain-containing protein n=1 Tax=Parascaris univalens TaxID=6257 RepID=A0A915ALY8_PARUN